MPLKLLEALLVRLRRRQEVTVQAKAEIGEESLPEDGDDAIFDDVRIMAMGWRHAVRAL